MTTEAQKEVPSQSSTIPDRDTVDAVNHLIQGKRHLLVQDIPSAVNSLQEACRLLAEHYGELANECGDAYFQYGTALLEMARRETGVLGNKLDGEEEDEDDDDEDEEEEEEEEEGESNPEKSSGEALAAAGTVGQLEHDANAVEASESVGGDSHILDSEAKSEDIEESDKTEEENAQEKVVVEKDSKPSDDVKSEVTDGGATSSAGDNAKHCTANKSEPAPKDDDEVSSLQLAWEVLELAKVIFKRQSENKREMQLKLAQVHSRLGEVGMESENYQQSIDDLLVCLRIQHELLPLDDRGIAETYYQLGLAYSYQTQFDEAIVNFKSAIKTIEDRIANLKKSIEEKNGVGDGAVDSLGDMGDSVDKEILELEGLLPELQEKITDTEDLKNSVKLPEVLDEGIIPDVIRQSPIKSRQEQDTKVSNIGHLVRKKRKPEDEPLAGKADDTKKPRCDSKCEIEANSISDAISQPKVNGDATEEVPVPKLDSEIPAE